MLTTVKGYACNAIKITPPPQKKPQKQKQNKTVAWWLALVDTTDRT